jgi:hypothetical protein
MNCEAVQHCLLASERPARLAADVAAHLAECAACLEWHRQLVQMEDNVPLLPVPPSSGKERLLRRLLAEPPAPPLPPPVPRHRLPMGLASLPHGAKKERAQRKLALASALAAALVLFALGWWGWQYNPPRPPPARKPPATDPLLASLLKRDLSLVKADSPRKRVETLAELADDLHKGTQALARAARADDLDALAGWYEKVRDGIVKQAGTLPDDEQRDKVLKRIADQLALAGRQADQLAAELTEQAPDSVKPLQRMASAARDGEKHLRDLPRGEKS